MSSDSLVRSWLSAPGSDSPAGPLFLSGQYAETEIAAGVIRPTRSAGMTGCGMCTGSICRGRGIMCL